MGKEQFGLNSQGKVVIEKGVWEDVVKGLGKFLFRAEVFKAFVEKEFSNQREAGEHMGLGTGTVNRLCRGVLYPSPLIVDVLNEAFPENDFLIRLPSFLLEQEKPILWGKVLLALSKDPESFAKVRKLTKGKSLKYMLREGLSVSPKTLMAICTLAKLDVHSVLNVNLPQVSAPQMLHWKYTKSGRQSLFSFICRAQRVRIADLARGTEINRKSISDWLYADKVPTFNSHIKLCLFFNVRFDFWEDWL